MKYLILVLGLGATLGLFYVPEMSDSVTFESLESKTETGAPVFNEIKLITQGDKDLWLMNQSHAGVHLPIEQWDRVAIVVDKSKSPMTADFFQTSQGPKNIESIEEVLAKAEPLKVRCFACHSNGPRLIRINTQSKSIVPSVFKNAKILWWNFKMKSYGKVVSRDGHPFDSGSSFRSDIPIFKVTINLKSCTECHSEKGQRQPLTMEQLGTADFMVKQGFMPPYPHKLSKEDAATLNGWMKN